MTAEVVVMNKEAVALAADSTVTLGGGRKTFDSANKLFMLAPGHSVGLMVFNNAAFMEMPWETIIKLYRDKILADGLEFATVADYASHFLEYLRASGDENDDSSSLIPEAQQEVVFRKTIDSVMNEMTWHIWQQVKSRLYDAVERLSHDEVEEIVANSIAQIHEEWDRFDDLYTATESESLKGRILDKYGQLIADRRDAIFDRLPLSEMDKSRIEEVCLFPFLKERLLPYWSGLAFAGFGRDDVFPSCVAFSVENVVCNRLKHKQRQEGHVSFDQVGGIIPFAQAEVVANFIDGVHPIYAEFLRERLRIESGMDEAKINGILADVGEQVGTVHTLSILETVASLPKDELAAMAENLVSITSFMRKVSMDIETVGGPIDVAVISKKDGFIWVNRKHYFDIEFNPHFSASQERKGD